jgi:hypothetical protein
MRLIVEDVFLELAHQAPPCLGVSCAVAAQGTAINKAPRLAASVVDFASTAIPPSEASRSSCLLFVQPHRG